MGVEDVQKTLERNLTDPLVADLPMVIAAEPIVDAATFTDVLGATCASGVSSIVLAAPGELPLKP